MRIAMADLRLDHLFVVHPGERTYPMQDRITAVAPADIDQAMRSLGLA